MPFLNPRTISARYSGAVVLTAGTIQAASDKWETEKLHDGLKIIIVDDGYLKCKLPNAVKTEISGPCICAVWNEGQFDAMQSFGAGQHVKHTTITLSADALEDHISDSGSALRNTLGINKGYGPKLISGKASKTVRNLCRQIAACPFTGPARDLFLSGKALELAALSLASFDQYNADVNDLSSASVEKIHRARLILEARLSNPPSLFELAMAVGLNPRKLSNDFRKVLGMSVQDYMHQTRLDTAYRILLEDGVSVSSAAYEVGYSPAHLSVVFRKRFGFSPKELRK